MPIFILGKKVNFPDPRLSLRSGLLAIGGDLSSRTLLKAYGRGIFPWFSEGDPFMWWSPAPRLVIPLDSFHLPKSLKRVLNKGQFTVTLDTHFPEVIHACRELRLKKEGTWITPDMLEAYIRLHELGYAHSAEVWLDRQLAGGIYGVSLGKCFFAESMFHHVSQASKVALVHLALLLKKMDFLFIDCQITTQHLLKFGAREIPRKKFLLDLQEGLRHKTRRGPWTNFIF